MREKGVINRKEKENWNSDIRSEKKIKIFGRTCDIEIWMGI
jgi:hypothetical protein